jgi:hypothetical protein
MTDRAALDIAEFRGTYSDDLEIDHTGILVWVRPVRVGSTIKVPCHFRNAMRPNKTTLSAWLASL